jgi:Ca2+-binding RTX toxin-like protein
MSAPTPITGQTSLLLSPEDGTSRSGAEYDVRVAGLADGGFVSIWLDFLPKDAVFAPGGYPAADGYDADEGRTVMVRRFDADGNALGVARPVSLDFTGDAGGLGIVTLTSGKVAIGWTAQVDPDGSGPGPVTSSKLVVAIYDPGTGTSSQVTVSGGALSEGLEFHQVVALSGGRAGALYFDRAGTDTLKLLIVNADGSAGDPVTLLTNAGTNPWVPAIGITDAAVALTGSNADVLALVTATFSGFGQSTAIRFFDLDGTAAALPPFALPAANGYIPVVEALPDGGLAIAYATTVTGTTSFVARVHRLDAAGAEVGTPTDVTFAVGYFGTLDLLALPDGGLVVAAGGIGAGFNFGAYAQRLTSTGALDGGLVSLDGGLSGEQSRPQLALAGSEMVAGWFDASNMFNYAVRASRFDLGLAPPGGESLPGTGSADTLDGGEQADTIVGGDGNDLLRGAGEADTIQGDGGADTLQGGAGGDTLAGGLGADVLLGGEGNDLIRGEDGIDSLNGGSGADTLLGGAGSDALAGGTGDDSILGGASNDRAGWAFADGGADTVNGGADNDTVVASGGAGADTISLQLTGPLADVFVLDAGGGQSLRLAGIEVIEVFTQGGNDRLAFAGDTLTGMPRLTFDLGDGADSFQGSGTLGVSVQGWLGADTLGGGGGRDSLDGSEGNDVLRGGLGADSLQGGGGNDSLLGENGADTLLGGANNDTLDGVDGNDRVQGDAGNDVLRGGNGNDVLLGGQGADTIIGGAGADTMTGGTEADRFRFLAVSDIDGDRITLFVAGVDKLDFAQFDADPLTVAKDAYEFIGSAAFDGGAAKAQIRVETDAVLNRILVQVDGNDEDAVFDAQLFIDGIVAIGAGDLILVA